MVLRVKACEEKRWGLELTVEPSIMYGHVHFAGGHFASVFFLPVGIIKLMMYMHQGHKTGMIKCSAVFITPVRLVW